MLSLIAFIVVLSVLIIVHEFGHFIVAKKIGVRVEKFSIGFGPELLGIKKGETRYSISIIPLGGYIKLSGETHDEPLKGERWEYLSRPVGERSKIILAGPLLNYLLAFIIFSFIFLIGYPALSTKVGDVLPDYPGINVGIKIGDKILKVNGQEVKYWEDVTKLVHNNKEPQVKLLIKRDGTFLDLALTPKTGEFKTIFGTKRSVGLIGILPSDEVLYVRYNLTRSIYMGARKLLDLTYITCRALWASLTGAIPFKDSITGPIGIFYITGQAARLGLVYLLHLMGVLSASLAIFNLLPVPVLDGGHILFLAIEKMRRKPLSHKLQENMTQVGLALIICLMVFVFYNDFMRYEILEKISKLWSK